VLEKKISREKIFIFSCEQKKKEIDSVTSLPRWNRETDVWPADHGGHAEPNGLHARTTY